MFVVRYAHNEHIRLTLDNANREQFARGLFCPSKKTTKNDNDND
jgi:hypothetical protein